MMQYSARLNLETLFVLDSRGRITSTREPTPSTGPRLSLIRSTAYCAWAVHADVPVETAAELVALARQEPPATDFSRPPIHGERYVAIAGGRISSGPAFQFPQALSESTGVVLVDDLAVLHEHFRGWIAGEIEERAPIFAVLERGHAVSVCFCARRSAVAAEAGLETAVGYRGRGLGRQVTAAWAQAIRASGRLPIYSTSWSNHASLAVARKLGLVACASHWSLLP